MKNYALCGKENPKSLGKIEDLSILFLAFLKADFLELTVIGPGPHGRGVLLHEDGVILVNIAGGRQIFSGGDKVTDLITPGQSIVRGYLSSASAFYEVFESVAFGGPQKIIRKSYGVPEYKPEVTEVTKVSRPRRQRRFITLDPLEE